MDLSENWKSGSFPEAHKYECTSIICCILGMPVRARSHCSELELNRIVGAIQPRMAARRDGTHREKTTVVADAAAQQEPLALKREGAVTEMPLSSFLQS